MERSEIQCDPQGSAMKTTKWQNHFSAGVKSFDPIKVLLFRQLEPDLAWLYALLRIQVTFKLDDKCAVGENALFCVRFLWSLWDNCKSILKSIVHASLAIFSHASYISHRRLRNNVSGCAKIVHTRTRLRTSKIKIPSDSRLYFAMRELNGRGRYGTYSCTISNHQQPID